MATPAKRILASVALSIFALAFSLAICEFVVRLLYKNETILFPRYHTDYRYGPYTLRGIRPNAEFWHTSIDGSWRFATNSKGFRNEKEFTYAKSSNTLRVLSLGDSHTQGYEVRQAFTFSAALERLLEFHGVSTDVINTGVSGFSTAEELVFLENEGFKYNPDVVVLGFYANDFEDNLKAGLFSLGGNNQLVEEKFEHIPGVHLQNVLYSIPTSKWLSENSYFYSLLFNSVWTHFKARLAERARRQASGKGVISAAKVAGFEIAVAPSEAYSAYEIALTAAIIERMHRFCETQGIRFIVVDIPNRPADYRFSSSLPVPLLERLKAARVEYINSESLFSDFDGAAEIHLPHGHHHISEFTHTLIAVEIGRRLLAPAKSTANR